MAKLISTQEAGIHREEGIIQWIRQLYGKSNGVAPTEYILERRAFKRGVMGKEVEAKIRKGNLLRN